MGYSKKARRVRKLRTPRPVGDWSPERLPEGIVLVPLGSAVAVLEWVGVLPDRARLALHAEQRRATPRRSLVAKLERIARAGD